MNHSLDFSMKLITHASQIRLLLLLIVVSAATGCSLGSGDGWRFTKSWDVRRAIGLQEDELTPPEIPTRLVSTWEDTVLNRAGQESQRGFGGRLLFFSGQSEDPVRVEGQLVVYAYDEDGRAAYETQPTRRFVIPAEQFARHESECQLGPSYSVWLPWDKVGGEQKNISLIARFEPKRGPLVVGDQTRHLLPGVRRLASGESTPAAKPIGEIQLTAYTQESKLQPPRQSKRSQVTSIALSNKSWQQRLRRTQSEQASNRSDSSEPAGTTVLPGPTAL